MKIHVFLAFMKKHRFLIIFVRGTSAKMAGPQMDTFGLQNETTASQNCSQHRSKWSLLYHKMKEPPIKTAPSTVRKLHFCTTKSNNSYSKLFPALFEMVTFVPQNGTTASENSLRNGWKWSLLYHKMKQPPVKTHAETDPGTVRNGHFSPQNETAATQNCSEKCSKWSLLQWYRIISVQEGNFHGMRPLHFWKIKFPCCILFFLLQNLMQKVARKMIIVVYFVIIPLHFCLKTEFPLRFLQFAWVLNAFWPFVKNTLLHFFYQWEMDYSFFRGISLRGWRDENCVIFVHLGAQPSST